VIWIPLAIWALAGTSLLGPPAIWKGSDPNSQRKHYSPAKVEYRSWASSPNRKDGKCEFTVFALATREAQHYLKVDGVEQEGTDWSWSFTRTVPLGYTLDVEFTFIDALTAEETVHRVSDPCWVVVG